jgi:hypothetical protein
MGLPTPRCAVAPETTSTGPVLVITFRLFVPAAKALRSQGCSPHASGARGDPRDGDDAARGRTRTVARVEPAQTLNVECPAVATSYGSIREALRIVRPGEGRRDRFDVTSAFTNETLFVVARAAGDGNERNDFLGPGRARARRR